MAPRKGIARAPVKDIDQAEMNEMFTYDAATGQIFWKKATSRNKIKAGTRAGSPLSDGYRQVRANGIIYKLHRVVWVMHFGEIPEGKVVNHKDRNRSNNRLENLEVVWPHENVAHGMLAEMLSKEIYCHETSTVYPSLKQAAADLKLSACNISMVLHNRRKTAGGKTFSYASTTTTTTTTTTD